MRASLAKILGRTHCWSELLAFSLSAMSASSILVVGNALRLNASSSDQPEHAHRNEKCERAHALVEDLGRTHCWSELLAFSLRRIANNEDGGRRHCHSSNERRDESCDSDGNGDTVVGHGQE